MNNAVFISYRRDDSAGYTRALYKALSDEIGADRIYMDVDSIEPGVDFVQSVESGVSHCAALLAVIGKEWLSASDDTGQRRLDNPKDYVRLEIATALGRNIRVIPVLVEGASMPAADELPDDLRPLARRNAIQLSHTGFEGNVDRLVESLRTLLGIEKNDVQHPLDQQRTTPVSATNGSIAAETISPVAGGGKAVSAR